VNTDHNILNIVLRNLVHNAIKYTPSGGSIHLHAMQQDGTLIVRVQDSGVGIDEQHIARLFDKRILYTTAGTHKEAGTGLGLSLCYELIRLLDGDISVHSIPREGSTFTVSVPLV
jgi:signal transduction histidine kinase